MQENMPLGAVEVDGRVYRRTPWKGHACALVLIGNMVDIRDAAGKPTGNKTFIPLAQKDQSTDPLKSAARKAHKKAQADGK